jgi:hypothetical protein
MTKKQLIKFCRVRGKSGFSSNLQFAFDAEECGFDVEELGRVQTFQLDGFWGYQWKPQTDKGSVPF